MATGVIEQFLHAPLALCSRELVAAPISGSGYLQRVRGPILVDAQGLELSVLTVPAGRGLIDGNPPLYIDRLAQFSVVHRLIDTSEVFSETFDVNYDGQVIQWSTALPDRVEYVVAPGVSLIARWLIVV